MSMKKRLLSLFALTLIVLVGVAPAALADHCAKCNTAMKCRPAPGNGAASCNDTTPGICLLSGTCGGPHPFVETEQDPFGADFIVASVERIDDRVAEPRPTPSSEPQVASLETPPAAKR
jgi:hypothetical protein